MVALADRHHAAGVETKRELLFNHSGVAKFKRFVHQFARFGERSSHTWFVLHELLGYPSVKNYDGSWTEWGNILRTPIEK